MMLLCLCGLDGVPLHAKHTNTHAQTPPGATNDLIRLSIDFNFHFIRTDTSNRFIVKKSDVCTTIYIFFYIFIFVIDTT